ncbi:MAG TPA: alpha/beta hydrolase, partial [Jatrophihabitans sp.]|nr:alpha/beta hydrolase [Jatrophihabitans sp.]
MIEGGRTAEQTRARYPDREGLVERDGVHVHYEQYGDGTPVILLLPTWTIVHSRMCKAQIPYLSRHARVVTFDPRGNGKSDRPKEPALYDEREFALDACAVLDALEVQTACVVGHSMGAQRALVLAADHPERVSGAVFIAPAVPLGPQSERAHAIARFDEELPAYDGWHKYNRRYWSEHYADFVEFFFAQVYSEPHSTKQIEDAIGYALDTDAETLAASACGPALDESEVRRLAAKVRCPTLVVHGSDDRVRTPESGRLLAELLHGRFVLLDGSGHSPHARDPVKLNMLIREFACAAPPVARPRTRSAGRRALFISSPIGLGHAQRDVAIADELRK